MNQANDDDVPSPINFYDLPRVCAPIDNNVQLISVEDGTPRREGHKS